MSITVEAKLIAALLKVAGKKDKRYFLNGIRVQRNDQGTFLIATNGHVIAVKKVGPAGELHDSQLWREDAALLPKRGQLELTIGSAGKFSLFTQGNFALNTSVDNIGDYPKWQQVIHLAIKKGFHEQSAPASYDAGYMKMISDVFKADDKRYQLTYTGENSGIIATAESTGIDLICVMMPMNCEPVDIGDIDFEGMIGGSDDNDK